jgi:cytochrome c oxidase subunit 3
VSGPSTGRDRIPAEIYDRDRWLPPGAPPGGDDGRSEPPPASQSWANARLGMGMLLAGESMFFGGLILAFLQLRLAASVWPPPLQPRLPVGLTAVNTGVLLLSSYTMARGQRAVRREDPAGSGRWLAATLGLGLLFLAIQGFEWARLVGFGLNLRSGAYGATFYTLIGTHGFHVVGAVAWLALVTRAARRGRYTSLDHVPLSCCAMYWHYVVALWPVLYVLVYLA